VKVETKVGRTVQLVGLPEQGAVEKLRKAQERLSFATQETQ
jgi:hypothetical protein